MNRPGSPARPRPFFPRPRTMPLLPILADWAETLLRWLHLVAATAWLGAFYGFLVLDRALARGDGAAWAVGYEGPYRVTKAAGVPPAVAQDLARFRWPAYATWAAGFLLFLLVYAAEPRLRLLEPGAALPGWAASTLALGSLLLGYLLYEAACRAPFAQGEAGRLAGVLLLLLALAVLHEVLLEARAALLLDGALAGTIMVANIAHAVSPAERRLLAAAREGRQAPPEPRVAERLRHNRVLALPVLLAMLAGHAPPAPPGTASAVFALVLLVSAALVVGSRATAAVDAGAPAPQKERQSRRQAGRPSR